MLNQNVMADYIESLLSMGPWATVGRDGTYRYATPDTQVVDSTLHLTLTPENGDPVQVFTVEVREW